MKAWKLSLSWILLLALASPSPAADVMDHLQAITVVVEANGGEGTGTLFTRRVGSETRTYVWTAAHVAAGLRQATPHVDSDTGEPRLKVTFGVAQIIQEVVEHGAKVDEVRLPAKVIRYSSIEDGHDLALLEIFKRNVADVSAEFHLNERIPPIGAPVIHVGNLVGEYANSTTMGIISAIGRVLVWDNKNPRVFDQTTALSAKGSSGGGIFLRNGTYIGMVQRAPERVAVNFICPVRRIRKWAEEAGVAWAMDPSVPMPSDQELADLPVED